jgi:hypothetical protein
VVYSIYLITSIDNVYSVNAGAAHIAFTAPSRSAVRGFYAAALNAGGRPNGAPSSRTDDDDHFNAAVLDFDGNSIEVVFRNAPDLRTDGTVIEHSRVITWQRSIAETYQYDRTVTSAHTSYTASRQTVAPASVAPSTAPVVVSMAPTIASMASMATTAANMVRSVSAEVSASQAAISSNPTDSGAAKTLIGTLLGAAAGATVAYALYKSEQDSAKKEKEFTAFMEAKAAQQAQSVAQPVPQPVPQPIARPVPQPVPQAMEQPMLCIQDQQSIYEGSPRSVHRDFSDTASQYEASHPYTVRAIEAAPSSYYAPPMYAVAPVRSVAPARSVAPTHVEECKQIEYYPAYSSALSRPEFTTDHRSFTDPELTVASRARSTISRAHSDAPSSLNSSYVSEQPLRRLTEGSISSFVSEQPLRRLTEGSVHSHNSSMSKSRSKDKSSDADSYVSKSRSKEKSSDSSSHVSKHSSHSKHTSKARSRAPSPPASIVEKAQSVIGSIFHRDAKSTVSKKDDIEEDDDFDFDEEYIEDGTDTVVPSDSISNYGGRRHRTHKSSRKPKDGSSSSEVSSHSSSSKDSRHSKSSKHHKHSHSHHNSSERKHSVHDVSSPLREAWTAEDDRRSESGEMSTLKPTKSKSHRKDSLVAGQYETLFNGAPQYGTGGVAVMPVRGTPSMVEAKEPKKSTSNKLMNFALAQKLRAFE